MDTVQLISSRQSAANSDTAGHVNTAIPSVQTFISSLVIGNKLLWRYRPLASLTSCRIVQPGLQVTTDDQMYEYSSLPHHTRVCRPPNDNPISSTLLPNV